MRLFVRSKNGLSSEDLKVRGGKVHRFVDIVFRSTRLGSSDVAGKSLC